MFHFSYSMLTLRRCPGINDGRGLRPVSSKNEMAEAGAPAPPAALLDVPEGPEQLGVHTLQTFGGRKSTPLSDFKLDKHRSGTPYKLEDDRWDPDHRVIGGVLGKHGLDTAEAEFARRARLNESEYGELGSHASGGTAGSPGGAGSPPRRVSTPAHHPPRPPHEGDSDEAASELMLTTFPLDLQTSLESSTASAKPAAGLDVTGRGCFKPTAPKIVSKRKSKAVVLREGDASDAAAGPLSRTASIESARAPSPRSSLAKPKLGARVLRVRRGAGHVSICWRTRRPRTRRRPSSST